MSSKRVFQKGPTCGLYALYLILKNLDSSVKEEETVLKFLDLLLNSKSFTGEIFSIEPLIYLCKEFSIPCQEMTFNSEADLRDLTYVAFSRGKFVLFPTQVVDWKLSTSTKPTNAHWVVLTKDHRNERFCKIKQSLPIFFTDRASIQTLYDSNKNLQFDFSWDAYFRASHLWEMNMTKNPILTKILDSASYKEAKTSKGLTSKVDLAGRCLVIG